jgi:CRISPR-associated protein (TIGR02584 family)
MSRTLIISVGLSPQVVTETIWWLGVRRSPPWTPDQVVIITTREGADRARATLLRSDSGRISALGREYGRADLASLADRTRIEVIASGDEDGFSDIDSDEAHQATADRTFAIVREFTSAPRGEVHASIAGGRKSQGAMLALSMALLGREGDTLSHVIVDDRFAGRPDFFYPPATSARLPADGGGLDTAEAHVRLATIPFPRLRARLPEDVFGSPTWADAVRSTQRALDPPRLTLHPALGRATLNDRPMSLPPAHFAWLAALARDRIDGGPGLARAGLPGSVVFRWRGAAGPVPAMLDEEQVEEWTSRLNKLVRTRHAGALDHNLIERVGRRPHSLYRLAISPETITWLD